MSTPQPQAPVPALRISRRTPAALKRSYRYLLPYGRTIGGAYLALVAIAALHLTIPQLIRWIIDSGVRQEQGGVLIGASLGLLGLALVRGIFTFLEGRWSEIASQNVAYDLRSDIQHKLTLLSFSFHDQTETGDLLARAVQDVERIRFLTGRATVRMIEAFLLLTGTSVCWCG
jgi:ATP-binding cassette, subfamily B, multidrug efflux pump